MPISDDIFEASSALEQDAIDTYRKRYRDRAIGEMPLYNTAGRTGKFALDMIIQRNAEQELGERNALDVLRTEADAELPTFSSYAEQHISLDELQALDETALSDTIRQLSRGYNTTYADRLKFASPSVVNDINTEIRGLSTRTPTVDGWTLGGDEAFDTALRRSFSKRLDAYTKAFDKSAEELTEAEREGIFNNTLDAFSTATKKSRGATADALRTRLKLLGEEASYLDYLPEAKGTDDPTSPLATEGTTILDKAGFAIDSTQRSLWGLVEYASSFGGEPFESIAFRARLGVEENTAQLQNNEWQPRYDGITEAYAAGDVGGWLQDALIANGTSVGVAAGGVALGALGLMSAPVTALVLGTGATLGGAGALSEVEADLGSDWAEQNQTAAAGLMAVSGLLDMVGLKGMVKPITSAFTKELASTTGKKAAKKVLEEYGRAAAKGILSKTTAGLTAREAIRGGVVEAGTELGQAALGLGTSLGYGADISGTEIIDRLLGDTLVGGTIGAPTRAAASLVQVNALRAQKILDDVAGNQGRPNAPPPPNAPPLTPDDGAVRQSAHTRTASGIARPVIDSLFTSGLSTSNAIELFDELVSNGDIQVSPETRATVLQVLESVSAKDENFAPLGEVFDTDSAVQTAWARLQDTNLTPEESEAAMTEFKAALRNTEYYQRGVGLLSDTLVQAASTGGVALQADAYAAEAEVLNRASSEPRATTAAAASLYQQVNQNRSDLNNPIYDRLSDQARAEVAELEAALAQQQLVDLTPTIEENALTGSLDSTLRMSVALDGQVTSYLGNSNSKEFISIFDNVAAAQTPSGKRSKAVTPVSRILADAFGNNGATIAIDEVNAAISRSAYTDSKGNTTSITPKMRTLLQEGLNVLEPQLASMVANVPKVTPLMVATRLMNGGDGVTIDVPQARDLLNRVMQEDPDPITRSYAALRLSQSYGYGHSIGYAAGYRIDADYSKAAAAARYGAEQSINALRKVVPTNGGTLTQDRIRAIDDILVLRDSLASEGLVASLRNGDTDAANDFRALRPSTRRAAKLEAGLSGRLGQRSDGAASTAAETLEGTAFSGTNILQILEDAGVSDDTLNEAAQLTKFSTQRYTSDISKVEDRLGVTDVIRTEFKAPDTKSALGTVLTPNKLSQIGRTNSELSKKISALRTRVEDGNVSLDVLDMHLASIGQLGDSLHAVVERARSVAKTQYDGIFEDAAHSIGAELNALYENFSDIMGVSSVAETEVWANEFLQALSAEDRFRTFVLEKTPLKASAGTKRKEVLTAFHNGVISAKEKDARLWALFNSGGVIGAKGGGAKLIFKTGEHKAAAAELQRSNEFVRDALSSNPDFAQALMLFAETVQSKLVRPSFEISARSGRMDRMSQKVIEGYDWAYYVPLIAKSDVDVHETASVGGYAVPVFKTDTKQSLGTYVTDQVQMTGFPKGVEVLSPLDSAASMMLSAISGEAHAKTAVAAYKQLVQTPDDVPWHVSKFSQQRGYINDNGVLVDESATADYSAENTIAVYMPDGGRIILAPDNKAKNAFASHSVMALKDIKPIQPPGWTRATGRATSAISSLFTRLIPSFGPTNSTRDFFTQKDLVYVHHGGRALADFIVNATRTLTMRPDRLWRVMTGKVDPAKMNNHERKLFRAMSEFSSHGGMAYLSELYANPQMLDARTDASIYQELRKRNVGLSRARETDLELALRDYNGGDIRAHLESHGVGRRAVNKGRALMNEWNEFWEQLPRVVSYMTVRDAELRNNMSYSEATRAGADFGRNILNYSRRGELAHFIRAWDLFFGANLHSTMRIIRSRSRATDGAQKRRFRNLIMAKVGFGVAFAAARYYLLFDNDDEREAWLNSNPRDYANGILFDLDLEQNTQFGTPARPYLTSIPNILGHHIFAVSEKVRKGALTPETVAEHAKAYVEQAMHDATTFSDVSIGTLTGGGDAGVAESLLRLVAADPWVELIVNPVTNRTSFGSPIKPEYMTRKRVNDKLKERASLIELDDQRKLAETRMGRYNDSPVYDSIADDLHSIGVDVHPRVLKYYGDLALRPANKTTGILSSTINLLLADNLESMELAKLPLERNRYSNELTAYYAARDKAQAFEDWVDLRKNTRLPEDVQAFRRNLKKFKSLDKRIERINKQIKEIEATPRTAEGRVKRLDLINEARPLRYAAAAVMGVQYGIDYGPDY